MSTNYRIISFFATFLWQITLRIANVCRSLCKVLDVYAQKLTPKNTHFRQNKQDKTLKSIFFVNKQKQSTFSIQ